MTKRLEEGEDMIEELSWQVKTTSDMRKPRMIINAGQKSIFPKESIPKVFRGSTKGLKQFVSPSHKKTPLLVS